jgi:hypothetical protein
MSVQIISVNNSLPIINFKFISFYRFLERLKRFKAIVQRVRTSIAITIYGNFHEPVKF